MTSLIDIKIYLFDCLFSLPMVYHVFDICRQVSSDVKIWGHHLDRISPLYQAVPVSKFDFVNLSNLLSLNTKLATVGDAFSPDYILNDDKLVTLHLWVKLTVESYPNLKKRMTSLEDCRSRWLWKGQLII